MVVSNKLVIHATGESCIMFATYSILRTVHTAVIMHISFYGILDKVPQTEC